MQVLQEPPVSWKQLDLMTQAHEAFHEHLILGILLGFQASLPEAALRVKHMFMLQSELRNQKPT